MPRESRFAPQRPNKKSRRVNLQADIGPLAHRPTPGCKPSSIAGVVPYRTTARCARPAG
jgi:hypothetical protein